MNFKEANMENKFKKFFEFVNEKTEKCECECTSCKEKQDCKNCSCDPCNCNNCKCEKD